MKKFILLLNLFLVFAGTLMAQSAQQQLIIKGDGTKYYDGKPFGPATNDGYTIISENGLAQGDSAVVVITNTEAVCPGEYPNDIVSVTIYRTGETVTDVTENYAITTQPGTLIIRDLACEGIDYNGRFYEAVKIGEQCWMKENLRFDTLENSVYKNEEANLEKFGRLYTWYAAMGIQDETELANIEKMQDVCNGNFVQGICPQGWAIPTNADFEVLSQNIAGMQSIKSDNSNYWIPSEIGDNSTGFDARGAGLLNAATARFENLLSGTYYWTCDGVFNVGAYPAGIGSSMAVTYYCDNFIPTPSNAKDMKSIRCIRKAAYEEDECIITDGNEFWIDFVDDYYTAEIWFDYSAGQLTADAVSATINDEPVSPDFISIQYEENTSFAVISIPVDQVDDQFTMVVTIAAPGCNPKVLRGSYGVDECFGFDGAPTVTQNNNNDGLPVSLDLSITIKNMELGDVSTDGLEFYIDNGLEYDDDYYFRGAAEATLQDNVMTGTFNITADNYDKLVGKNLNIKARLDYDNEYAVLCEGNDLGDPGVLLSEPAIHNFNGDCPAFVGTPKFEEVTDNNEIVAINFSVKVKNVPSNTEFSFALADYRHRFIYGDIEAQVNNNVMTGTLDANSYLYGVSFSDLLSRGFLFHGEMRLPDALTTECFGSLGEGNILRSEEADYWVEIECPVVPDAFTITKNANGDYVGSFDFEGSVDFVDGSWEVEDGNSGSMEDDYYVIANNTITITIPADSVGEIPEGKTLTVYAIPTLGYDCEDEAEGTYTEPTSTTSDCPSFGESHVSTTLENVTYILYYSLNGANAFTKDNVTIVLHPSDDPTDDITEQLELVSNVDGVMKLSAPTHDGVNYQTATYTLTVTIPGCTTYTETRDYTESCPTLGTTTVGYKHTNTTDSLFLETPISYYGDLNFIGGSYTVYVRDHTTNPVSKKMVFQAYTSNSPQGVKVTVTNEKLSATIDVVYLLQHSGNKHNLYSLISAAINSGDTVYFEPSVSLPSVACLDVTGAQTAYTACPVFEKTTVEAGTTAMTYTVTTKMAGWNWNFPNGTNYGYDVQISTLPGYEFRYDKNTYYQYVTLEGVQLTAQVDLASFATNYPTIAQAIEEALSNNPKITITPFIAIPNSSCGGMQGEVTGEPAIYPEPATGHALSQAVKGDIICSDGLAYAGTAYNNLPDGVTAVALVCYVTSTPNGNLAFALADEGSMSNGDALSACSIKTTVPGGSWTLPDQGDWNDMIEAAGSSEALRTGFLSVGGANMELTTYWSSSDAFNTPDEALYWNFSNAQWGQGSRYDSHHFRACLRF